MDNMTSMRWHYFFLTKRGTPCMTMTTAYVSKVLKTALRIAKKNSIIVPPVSDKNKAVWWILSSIKENMEKRRQPRRLSVGWVVAS